VCCVELKLVSQLKFMQFTTKQLQFATGWSFIVAGQTVSVTLRLFSLDVVNLMCLAYIYAPVIGSESQLRTVRQPDAP